MLASSGDIVSSTGEAGNTSAGTRNRMKNKKPCEECTGRKVRCVWIRNPEESDSPLCEACSKWGASECRPRTLRRSRVRGGRRGRTSMSSFFLSERPTPSHLLELRAIAATAHHNVAQRTTGIGSTMPAFLQAEGFYGDLANAQVALHSTQHFETPILLQSQDNVSSSSSSSSPYISSSPLFQPLPLNVDLDASASSRFPHRQCEEPSASNTESYNSRIDAMQNHPFTGFQTNLLSTPSWCSPALPSALLSGSDFVLTNGRGNFSEEQIDGLQQTRIQPYEGEDRGGWGSHYAPLKDA
ncbi:hypothetical protein SCHPADRAFT_629684 [Schizopora paradoxa]|uniref:Zn(2)-C6 fungal-type domain-containing protein n=1 Tax=Schizopora paradoxa TaxID=27342 RepID=A0A0H2RE84_9AGAM|nr:hypothetical protein SCHPADRAFT_629684 [Schizopora paradoxa]